MIEYTHYSTSEFGAPALCFWNESECLGTEGKWDVDLWEEATITLIPIEGVGARTFYKAAHRAMRVIAKKFGGYQLIEGCDDDPRRLPR